VRTANKVFERQCKKRQNLCTINPILHIVTMYVYSTVIERGAVRKRSKSELVKFEHVQSQNAYCFIIIIVVVVVL